MRIAIPREVKTHEYRVAITPAGVHELVSHGHEVFVEVDAGLGSSISNDAYIMAGATLLPGPEDTWRSGDLILKVKEPVPQEFNLLQEEQVLFAYLHLAADRPLTDELIARRVVGIAYETVGGPDGSLPLLAPMSEVAGRLAPQVGAHALMRSEGGRGLLMGGVPGVAPAQVLILGGGVAGMAAATIASGMNSQVTLLDRNIARLRECDRDFGGRVRTLMSSTYVIEEQVPQSDLVIGAVLIPGAKAPRLVTNELVSRMKPGSVLIDISIDQGGCFEDSRPTTHADPTYTVHESIMYCVTNIPGAVAHTSTHALTNATLPYVSILANLGWRNALAADPALRNGLNTCLGQVTHPGVAQAHDLSMADAASVVANHSGS